jgi:hypothetical protein
MVGIFSVKCL